MKIQSKRVYKFYLMEPSRYIGRCPQQVEEFLKEQVAPALAKYQDCLKDEDTELKV